MIYKFENAKKIEKYEVKMSIYNTKKQYPNSAVVYQETEIGHTEEFFHEKSAFIYYIIGWNGKWIIEDEIYEVNAKDVVIVPPGKRFYFKGNLKQICVTTPAWDEKYEKQVRYIKDMD